ncbi:MAG: MFS transporter [Candidatus Sumerlaeota bacterium]|nr:MFS transporter [Candidatus Sumerlaeota bacterium]
MLRALRYRNYALFFFGQGTSQIGTWMQRVALGFLVYRLTHSGFLLGVVGFSSQILALPAAPFAGVFADRFSRRKLLVIIQSVAALQALVLAILTLAGVVTVWEIVALGALLGLVHAFDMPTRQSFVVEMVETNEDLPNAIALNSILVNGAKLIGPSLAGLLIAPLGEGICFLLNAISYLAVIVALLAMRLRPAAPRLSQNRVLTDLKEGFDYAFCFAPIRAILTQLALVSMMGMSYATLLPKFSQDILHGGPRLLGLLYAAPGLGAIPAGLIMASRRRISGFGRILAVASGLFGAGLILFSFSRSQALSLILLAVVGFGMMAQMISGNTLLQTISDDDKRGRVMSFYAMSLFGMSPLGSLLAGALDHLLGSPGAVLIGGVCCVLGASFFFSRLPKLNRTIHPILDAKAEKSLA